MSRGPEPGKAVITAHLQVEWGAEGEGGEIMVTLTKPASVLTSGLLFTRKHKQRKWEKEVERERGWTGHF